MYFFNLWQVKKVKKVFSTFPDAVVDDHALACCCFLWQKVVDLWQHVRVST